MQIEGGEQAPALLGLATAVDSSHHNHSQHHLYNGLPTYPPVYPQQQQPQPLEQQPTLPLQEGEIPKIYAPQPRSALLLTTTGRESPTKVLEEKLEELLLEPRPRSRVVVPGQPGHSGHSKSRSASGTGTGTGKKSRSGSRVPSMSFLSPGSGSIGSTGGGGGTDEKSIEHHDINSVSNNNNTLSPHNTLHLNPNNPRARVISLSRSHRLSGVEVWEDSHRHPFAVPPSSDEDNDGRDSEVRDEDGVVVEQVKELEPGLGEEEEVEGIEALLEEEVVLPSVVVVPKHKRALLLPLLVLVPDTGKNQAVEAQIPDRGV